MTDNVAQNIPNIINILDEISNLVSRYMIVRHEEAQVAALWIAHSYVYRMFRHTPRLSITSPEKQCGKSTLLKILSELSYNPLKVDNISAAGIYRAISASKAMSMLVDEADTFINRDDCIRGIINSGFEETGAVVRVECADGIYKSVTYSTFCPIALAGIGLLPETIMDRAIPIRLKRKAPGERIDRLPRPCPEFEQLKRLLQTWGDAVDLSRYLNPDIPPSFQDRQGDISIPLLAIADSAGGDWPMAARVALSEIFGAVGNSQEAASASSILLADIRDLFDASGQDFVSSADICLGLANIEDHPWGEWNRGRPISKHDLAGLLVPFGIRPFQRRLGQVVTRGYRHEDFADAWLRYTPKA